MTHSRSHRRLLWLEGNEQRGSCGAGRACRACRPELKTQNLTHYKAPGVSSIVSVDTGFRQNTLPSGRKIKVL